jgi:hypothetical protein
MLANLSFAAVAVGTGAYGKRLVDPIYIHAALDRAFNAAYIEGRSAVLQVALGSH